MNPGIISRDFELAFPVDTWVDRITKKLGCQSNNLDETKEYLLSQCSNYGIDPLKIAAGLWYLGFHSLDILLEECLGAMSLSERCEPPIQVSD